jgi:hypothetical protein
MNSWSISFQEVSAGHFVGKAQRDTGNLVEMDGTEDLLPRLFQNAYQLEISMGTKCGEAAYIISKAAKPKWKWQYFERIFGSWSGTSDYTSFMVDYDGKDFIAVASTENRSKSLWTGRIKDAKEDLTPYFTMLASQT